MFRSFPGQNFEANKVVLERLENFFSPRELYYLLLTPMVSLYLKPVLENLSFAGKSATIKSSGVLVAELSF